MQPTLPPEIEAFKNTIRQIVRMNASRWNQIIWPTLPKKG